jgi:hypothetical protein
MSESMWILCLLDPFAVYRRMGDSRQLCDSLDHIYHISLYLHPAPRPKPVTACLATMSLEDCTATASAFANKFVVCLRPYVSLRASITSGLLEPTLLDAATIEDTKRSFRLTAAEQSISDALLSIIEKQTSISIQRTLDEWENEGNGERSFISSSIDPNTQLAMQRDSNAESAGFKALKAFHDRHLKAESVELRDDIRAAIQLEFPHGGFEQLDIFTVSGFSMDSEESKYRAECRLPIFGHITVTRTPGKQDVWQTASCYETEHPDPSVMSRREYLAEQWNKTLATHKYDLLPPSKSSTLLRYGDAWQTSLRIAEISRTL